MTVQNSFWSSGQRERNRYKARILEQNFTQKYGNNYDENFAPLGKQVTFRTLLKVVS